jgi:hypothetical protein
MAASSEPGKYWVVDEPDAFVASLDPTDESAYCKAWKRCFFVDSIEIKPEVLEAAFVALDHWGMAAANPSPREFGIALAAVVRVIFTRMLEHPEEAPALITRWASYQLCPNFEVASHALFRLTLFPQHRELIVPIASRIARSSVPWTEPTANSMRGVAVMVLLKLAPEIAMQPEFREARHDLGRAILRYWEKPKPRIDRMAQLNDLLRARRLLSS